MLTTMVAISHGEVGAAVRPWSLARPVSALIETSAAPYRMPPAAASVCVRRCLASRHTPAQTHAEVVPECGVETVNGRRLRRPR